MKNIQRYVKKQQSLFFVLISLSLVVFSGDVMSLTLGDMAASITKSFNSIAKLVTGGAYVAGMAFAVGAIIQFKAHKDNPTQVPIGKPIALVLIAAALIFLPTILSTTGSTMFGSGVASTAGPAGTIFTPS